MSVLVNFQSKGDSSESNMKYVRQYILRSTWLRRLYPQVSPEVKPLIQDIVLAFFRNYKINCSGLQAGNMKLVRRIHIHVWYWSALDPDIISFHARGTFFISLFPQYSSTRWQIQLLVLKIWIFRPPHLNHANAINLGFWSKKMLHMSNCQYVLR